MTDAEKPDKPVKINYTSNSGAAKKAEQGPDALPPLALTIGSGVAKAKKPSLGKKFREQFAGDSAGTVGQYILIDVIVPAIKNLIWDIGSEGLKRTLFGGGSRPGGGTFAGSILGSRQTSYAKMYSGSTSQKEITPATRATNDFSDVLVPTYAEGEEVLDQMQNYIDQYGAVTVNDYYAALGISADFTAVKYGWKSISSAEVRHTREGYLIVMPRPQILE